MEIVIAQKYCLPFVAPQYSVVDPQHEGDIGLNSLSVQFEASGFPVELRPGVNLRSALLWNNPGLQT